MAGHVHYDHRSLREELMADPEVAEAYEAARRGFELGQAVVKLRKKRGWSQGELAEAAGMSESAVDDLELGGPIPPMHVLERVAKAFGTNLKVQFESPDRSNVS